MESLFFCTTNIGKKKKVENEMKKINQNIRLKIIDIEINEIQNLDNEIVSTNKVKEVYNILKKPCFSIDSGLYIEELNNFPGSYIKDILQTIGTKGIIKLLDGIDNRKCYISNSLAYYDGVKVQVFTEKIIGEISYDISRNINNEYAWSDLHNIFITNNYNKVLSEMTNSEYIKWDTVEKENGILKQFLDWYK